MLSSRSSFFSSAKKIRGAGMWITFCAAIICLTAIILNAGLEHTLSSRRIVLLTAHICQIIFAINICFNLIFLFPSTVKINRPLKWIMDCAVLLTLIPLIWPRPTNPWIPVLDSFLYSPLFYFGVLGIYSILEISFGIARLLGKRTNPSLLLAGSFLFFILIGTLILMLPKCTKESISFIDSLFIATSAVSITGLTPLDISNVFTPLGIAILAILIQIGALGVLTFTSFFAMFFTGNTSVYSQLMVWDMVYSKNANSLLPTLLYVFVFTLSIEIIGAVAIFFSTPTDLVFDAPEHKILFAAFQSLSAFCNAGFTWLEHGMSNPILMNSNQLIYIVVGLLVMAGSIGFPILVNIKNIIVEFFHRCRHLLFYRHRPFHRIIHLYDVNTRIVLWTSISLTIVTIIFFLVFEWNNTLAGMNIWHKFAQAFFNSSIPRSSGFASVNPASFMPCTFILIMFLMWIGGASQSTGGGVKVNTFAAMLLNLKSIVTEKKYITVFKRTIAVGSVRRANSVIALSIVAYFLVSIILVGLEPKLSTKDLLFESASALFTVGSSLGITPELSTGSKILLCIAMFAGRVGLLSLLMGLCSHRQNDKRIYPYDNIIIN